jgi:hypothetical protein
MTSQTHPNAHRLASRSFLAATGMVAAALAVAIPSTSGASTSAVAAPPAMGITPATVVDPLVFGGEPAINFDPTTPDGRRSFIDWPVGSTQNIGVFFRSEDGGLSFTKRYSESTQVGEAGVLCTARQVPTCGGGGGGDTDTNVRDDGTVFFSSQESLGAQLAGTSFDHGLTFPVTHVDPVVSKGCAPVDRQWWASWKGTKTVFLSYHVPAVGQCTHRSDNNGAVGSWSVVSTPQVPLVTQSGALIADNSGGPNNHALYLSYNDFPSLQFAVAVSKDGAQTFEDKVLIPGSKNIRNFAKLNIDTAGNLYATWVQSDDNVTYLATSKASDPENITKPGSKWSDPVVVNTEGLPVTIFSDVVAGSPGRIAVTYYGTSVDAPSPDDVKPGQGGWYPYVSRSFNALCQWDAKPCASPLFREQRISTRPNQDDQICTAGTTCAADPESNRNLADFFDVALDKQGHLGFVWSDGNNVTKKPFVKVARQSSGASLIAGMPDAKLPVRTNGFGDAAGDAKYPTAGAQLKTSPNQPSLDIRATRVYLADADTMRVEIDLADTSNLGRAVVGGGTHLEGAYLVQQAKLVARWEFGGNAYYAGANITTDTSPDTPPSFFSGTVSTAEQAQGVGTGNPYGNTYKPLTAATGKVIGKTVQIDVPASAVGSPAKGARLVSVGSYAMVGPGDAAATLYTLPVASTPRRRSTRR